MFDNVGRTNDVEAARRRAISVLITTLIVGTTVGTGALYGLLTVAQVVKQVVLDEDMVEVVIEDPVIDEAPPPPPPPAGPATVEEEEEEDEKVPEEMDEVVKELDKEIKEEVKADVPTGGTPEGSAFGEEGGKEGGVPGGEKDGTGTTLGGYKTFHHSDVERKTRVDPDYPDAAREMNLGDVDCRVRMFIDDKGMPENVEFMACPKAFHDTVKEAFFKCRWYPAKVAGVKTKAQFVMVYRFTTPR